MIYNKIQKQRERKKTEATKSKREEQRRKTQTFTHGTDMVIQASKHSLTDAAAAATAACNLL